MREKKQVAKNQILDARLCFCFENFLENKFALNLFSFVAVFFITSFAEKLLQKN